MTLIYNNGDIYAGAPAVNSVATVYKLACSPLLYRPQNSGYVVFMQFSSILPKLSPHHQSTRFEKTCFLYTWH